MSSLFLVNVDIISQLRKGEERDLRFEVYCTTVEVLHRTSKWGEVRRLACPLRRFPFAAPPNCGGGKGTGFIGEL